VNTLNGREQGREGAPGDRGLIGGEMAPHSWEEEARARGFEPTEDCGTNKIDVDRSCDNPYFIK